MKPGDAYLFRENRKKLSDNESRAVELMNDLKSNAEIAGELGIGIITVSNFRRRYFNGSDPLKLHVIREYRSGKTVREIERNTGFHRGRISKIIRDAGFSPQKDFDDKCKTSLNSKIRVSRLSAESKANDALCFVKHCGSIASAEIETGWSGPYIGSLLARWIPGYQDQSRTRKEKSNWKKREQKHRKRSKTFGSEREFNNWCVGLLNGYELESNCNKVAMEADLVITGHKTLLVELKVSLRKKDFATATGQLLLQKCLWLNIGIDTICVMCVPDDVDFPCDLVKSLADLGITACKASRLLDTVERCMQSSRQERVPTLCH